jgi:site-specific DNA recombinase
LALGNELARLAEVQERLEAAEQRLAEIGEELGRLADGGISESEVAVALAEFDAVWAALVPREQGRVLQLLIERVDHDGQQGTVAIRLRPNSIKVLSDRCLVEEHAA